MLPVLEDLPPLPLLPLEVLITSLGLVYLDMESIMVLNLHPKERQRRTVTLLFIHILNCEFSGLFNFNMHI